MTNYAIPSDAEGVIFCVSTSHMDWDWRFTFEQYYTIGSKVEGQESVQSILKDALLLINSNIGYQYNLAEVAWLRRYMQDNPSSQPTSDMQGSFYFLGGGITSPDNLVCNGEAFIRNYLTGRAYIKSLGLGNLISNVCWVPDDFGHDPQLPVVLSAMGMTGVSFWRVPGLEPSAPEAPSGNSTTYNPTDSTIQPLSTQLAESGVSFIWEATDGTTILTQLMADSYGVIFYQPGADYTKLENLVTLAAQFHSQEISVNYPGNLYMAPCGGDFSPPSKNLLTAIEAYNDNYYQQNKIYAVIATFQDYIDALYKKTNQGNPLKTIQNFNAGNFWTGHFASRVQLKINQQRTVNRLMAAETLATLLQIYTGYPCSVLDELNTSIGVAWDSLVPSTHHDYVNGTSSDIVYSSEQLPLSNTALNQAESALDIAMKLLGENVDAGAAAQEFPFVVFNPSGFERGAATAR